MNKLTNITPFDECQLSVDDLMNEAKVWLDGDPVKTQEQADTVAKLLDLARKATKSTNKARVDEKRPHDEAGKAVQVKFKPLLDRLAMIADTCKKAVTPFIQEQEHQKREAERVAREQAESAELAAQNAMQQTSVGDIEERLEAEQLLDQAKAQTEAANKLAKSKGQDKGGARAVSLRTSYTPKLIGLDAAIHHYWHTNRIVFEALVLDQAVKDVRCGAREIPGFEIIEKQEAV